MRPRLFLGLLLIVLAFWKGDGGYLDLREYLDDAERLWLKGDLRLPAEEGSPAQYNRYSLGLPFLSGPLMLTGAAVQSITHGTIGRRAIAALTVPLLVALAGLLVFEIARMLKASPRIAVGCAIIFSLGTPQLTYSRVFYAEAAIVCGLLLWAWGYMRFQAPPPSWRGRWILLSGAGLTTAVASHYPHAPLAAVLWLGTMIVLTSDNAVAMRPSMSTRTKWKLAALFTAVPALAGTALIALNFSRYGQLVPPRYQQEVQSNFSTRYIPDNLIYLGRMLLRTPWFLPATIVGAIAFLSGTRKYPRDRMLGFSITFGILLQLIFWLRYNQLPMFATRYLHPLSALAVLGLPALLIWIDKRYPRRGLSYALLALLLSNALQFFGDTGSLPLTLDPDGRGMLIYAWYMQPAPQSTKFDVATPAGPIQYIMLAALIISGTALLLRASALAKKESGVF